MVEWLMDVDGDVDINLEKPGELLSFNATRYENSSKFGFILTYGDGKLCG